MSRFWLVLTVANFAILGIGLLDGHLHWDTAAEEAMMFVLGYFAGESSWRGRR